MSLLFAITVSGQSKDEVLTNASVINLYSKGLSSSIIVSKIKTSKTNFDVSTDALIQLKDQKIPDDIVNAMVDASANQENEPGDINDPNAIHESGLYYYKIVDTKPVMTELEPTVCAQAKMGGVFASALTYGIAKIKTKATIDGGQARLQLDDPNPVFYFYFDKGQNLNSSGISWFNASSSPNEFLLVKMDEKKKDREFVTGSANAYAGASSGVDDKYKVDFNIDKIKTGVYKVTPKKALVPGEYCFMYAGSTTIGGTSGKVFDFGIQKPGKSK